MGNKVEAMCSVSNGMGDEFPKYFEHTREEMINFVPLNAESVLDVGCGAGVFGRSLKRVRGCRVVGIELNDEAARQARQHLDLVFCQSVDDVDFMELGCFDVIVFNDVLEHLNDPWEILGRAKAALKPDGRIVASIPNVRFFPVIRDLIIKAEWVYRDSGVLDKTHLRFFTKKSIENLFECSGMTVDVIEGVGWSQLPLIMRAINRLSGGAFEDMYYMQHAVVAKLHTSSC
jgi:2-polyprenyl-3-methyl-5-hydroxy-6-metoxy-1,4-benzoquinol methylase